MFYGTSIGPLLDFETPAKLMQNYLVGFLLAKATKALCGASLNSRSKIG